MDNDMATSLSVACKGNRSLRGLLTKLVGRIEALEEAAAEPARKPARRKSKAKETDGG